MTHQHHIVLISGSVRENNNTWKALNVVANELEATHSARITRIDPRDMDLKLPGMGETEDAKKLQDLVQSADGVILATPEYHGSYSSVIKLIIENMGFPSRLKGKPIALLGVANGRIGAIKALEHLRSVASHVGGLVLPAPVSIAGVGRLFNEEGQLTDESIQSAVEGLAKTLVDYIDDYVCPRFVLENMVRAGALQAN